MDLPLRIFFYRLKTLYARVSLAHCLDHWIDPRAFVWKLLVIDADVWSITHHCSCHLLNTLPRIPLLLLSGVPISSSAASESLLPAAENRISQHLSSVYNTHLQEFICIPCWWVSNNAVFWNCQTHWVNDSIYYDFDWVFREIPVKSCIVGMLQSCKSTKEVLKTLDFKYSQHITKLR